MKSPNVKEDGVAWTLVVSEDEAFQREAIARLGSSRRIVGATGDAAARGLVRAVDVEQILVDALDDVGLRFLAQLRSLPSRRLPDVVAVDPAGTTPRFRTVTSLAAAQQPLGQPAA